MPLRVGLLQRLPALQPHERHFPHHGDRRRALGQPSAPQPRRDHQLLRFGALRRERMDPRACQFWVGYLSGFLVIVLGIRTAPLAPCGRALLLHPHMCDCLPPPVGESQRKHEEAEEVAMQ
uniref:Uncharacterized protein n=1 Tax=Steinernema glaseri TaxID=37863 RepID=A0A1I8AD98_9BILA